MLHEPVLVRGIERMEFAIVRFPFAAASSRAADFLEFLGPNLGPFQIGDEGARQIDHARPIGDRREVLQRSRPREARE